MELDVYRMQLEAVSAAANCSRWMTTVAVASLVKIGGAFDYGWGEMKSLVEGLIYGAHGHYLSKETPHGAGLNELRETIIKSWTEPLSADVSVLGIKFSILDVKLIGASTLIVIVIRLVCFQRRENHLSGSTCWLAKYETINTKAYVLYGTCATQEFATRNLDGGYPVRFRDGTLHLPNRTHAHSNRRARSSHCQIA